MKTFLIGSLPFTSIKRALDYSFRFSIPTLPTLPNKDRKELMVEQALSHTSEMAFSCSGEFFKRLAPVYKWQACGPLTLSCALKEGRERELERYFSKLINTQTRFNELSSARSIFFLDEPTLGFSKNIGPLKSFLKKLQENKAFKKTLLGLHVCSKAQLNDLMKLEFDLFSLDPSLYGEEEFSAIQSELGRRLVYTAASSDGEPLSYPPVSEVYASSACGQAMASGDALENLRKALKNPEAILRDRQDLRR